MKAPSISPTWLTGGLRISPEEQVEFLRRFYFGELGVSERSTAVLKEAMVLEETDTYRLSGKAGWAALGEDANIDIRENADAAARLVITREILRELGVIDP